MLTPLRCARAPRASLVFAFALAFALAVLSAPGVALAAPIEPHLQRQLALGDQEFFVVLDSRADVDAVATKLKHAPRAARTKAVRDALRDHAARTQAPLAQWLAARGIEYHSFHIINAVLVRGDARLAGELAARSDVLRIVGNPRIAVALPGPEQRRALLRKALTAVEPGIAATNAPSLWSQGITGQGVVVGSHDTGVAWTHAALKNQYRGWNGATASHDYNWHDSIHASAVSTNNPCGYDTTAPCDDGGHGTHTTGTAVGSDGAANQIGMAPHAQWIACRNMDQGIGKPSTYLECFEWFLAPYPVGGTPAQGDPARAPHVTINSWSCPPSEGCSPLDLQSAVEAHRAAGIMTVVAAGNGGPACSTIDDPPGIYDAAYSIAAYSTSTDALASFSSRGLVTIDGSNRQKPDIAAPGVFVRSAFRDGYEIFSGTSMATPHVAGAVALMWSALPELKGKIAETEAVLNASALHVASTACGTTGTPNAEWGYGKLDVAAAYSAAAQLVVARAGSGAGSVASMPPGIACGITCAATFAAGTPVTLTATPAPGSKFVGWLGACTGSAAACELQDATARVVTAGFAPTSSVLSADVDGNQQYDALTDGLMIARFLFGMNAASIASGATAGNATISAPAALLARLQDLRPLFDIDGNGQTEPLHDGILLIRYLFGLRGPQLTVDALGTGATRVEPAQIESYIATLLP
jgi:subtilisin family serine protease